MYVSLIGRFLQRDPIGYDHSREPLQQNNMLGFPNSHIKSIDFSLYQYADTNPLINTDPMGENPLLYIIPGIVVVVGVGFGIWYVTRPAHTKDLHLSCPSLLKILKSVMGGKDALQTVMKQNPIDWGDFDNKLAAAGAATVGILGTGIIGAGWTTSNDNQRFITMIESWRWNNSNPGASTHSIASHGDFQDWFEELWAPAELSRDDIIISDINDALKLEGCLTCGYEPESGTRTT
jgi:hypothetical protein